MKKSNKSVSRSDIMRTIKGKNTTPERIVRSVLHKGGFRFRLHNPDLPGKPDIILPKYNIIIRVMGCFWHGHTCKRGCRVPKTNQAYWIRKISRNKERDIKQKCALRKEGWRVIDFWECKLKSQDWHRAFIKKLIASKTAT